MSRSLLISTSLLFFAASSFAADPVKIHGVITHPLADSVTVSYADGSLGYNGKSVTAHLTADGHFSLSFQPKYKITSIQLKNGNQGTQTFVKAGDDLTVSIDAQDFDNTLHYEGRGSAMGNFMAVYVREQGVMYNYDRQVGSHVDKDPDAYLNSIQGEFDKKKTYLDEHGSGLSADLKDYWLAYFRYHNYKSMLEYPAWHQMAKTHSLNIKQTDPAFKRVVEAVPKAFNDDYAGLVMYDVYAQVYYDDKIMMRSPRPRNADSAAILEDVILDSMYANLPPATAERAIAGQQKMYMDQLPAAHNIKALKRYLAQFPNSSNRDELLKLLQMMERMSPGQPEIDFSFKTADGKEMRLSDLKGKAVYIDFWASWCGPCVMEMQIAKDIMPSFKDKDVVFLFVSLDREPDKWRKRREDLQVDGMHALLGGGFQNPVAQSYGVESLPSSFLIDKDGKFAVQSMPRPSNKLAFTAAIEKAIGN